nr:SGNH/GDSL hydrolase family protein [uncultured Sphaerochaeta sp.]
METDRYSISEEYFFSLVHNALSVQSAEDGFFRINRFTSTQKEEASAHPLYRAMANTAAGACLRFKTRSVVQLEIKRINQSLLPRANEGALDLASLYGRPLDLEESIDVAYEDGRVDYLPLKHGVIEIGPSEQVSIYLPLHHQVEVRLSGEVESIGRNPSMHLLLGDSIMQGVGIHHPSQSLGSMLETLTGSGFLNQGLAGTLISPRLVQELPLAQPLAGIIIGYGTNDWVVRENLAELRWEMFALLGRIRKFHPLTPVVVLTPLWRADIQQAKRMGSFAEMQAALMQATKCFPKVSVADGLSLSLRDSYDDEFLHPGSKAVAFLAKGLARQLV